MELKTLEPNLIKRRSELVKGKSYDIYLNMYIPHENTSRDIQLPNPPYYYYGYDDNLNLYKFINNNGKLRTFLPEQVEGNISHTSYTTDFVFGTRNLKIYDYKLPDQAPSAAAGGAGNPSMSTGGRRKKGSKLRVNVKLKCDIR